MEKDNPSLSKGLGLFKLIAKDGGQTPFRVLIERSGLPSSTAHRLLRVLRDQDLVSQVAPGRFDIGLEFIELCSQRERNAHLARVSRRILDKTARDLGLTVHLGVLEDAMVTYLVKSEGGTACDPASFTQEGMQLEAYCSGVGRILLSGLEEREKNAYLSDGPFVKLTERTETSPERLREILSTVASQKFARDDREISEDLVCLAVPVRLANGELVAAISASRSFPAQKSFNEQKIIQSLDAAAKKIAAKL